jgi:hypothetical protein
MNCKEFENDARFVPRAGSCGYAINALGQITGYADTATVGVEKSVRCGAPA